MLADRLHQHLATSHFCWGLALEEQVHKKDFKARRHARDATVITNTKAIL